MGTEPIGKRDKNDAWIKAAILCQSVTHYRYFVLLTELFTLEQYAINMEEHKLNPSNISWIL